MGLNRWMHRLPGRQLKNVYRAPAAAASIPVQPPSNNAFGAAGPGQAPVQRIKKPLFIQYGPTLRSYNETACYYRAGDPVRFRSESSVCIRASCPDPVFIRRNYWIKDLSGKSPMLINGRPVDREGILEPDCRLSMSFYGAGVSVFLGGGRLGRNRGGVGRDPGANRWYGQSRTAKQSVVPEWF